MNQPKQRLTLTRDEKESKLWKRLLEHCESRLQTLRMQNDGDKSEIETAKLRGRILEVKAFLGLDKDLPEID